LVFSVTSLTILMAISCGVTVPRVSDTRTCDDITDMRLRSLLHETLSPEDMKRRLAEIYGVLPGKVDSATNDDGSGYVKVSQQGMAHTLVTQDSHPIGGRLLFDSQLPSAQKVVQCLGNPEWYWAYYSVRPKGAGNPLALYMYWPSKGIHAYVIMVAHIKEPPSLDGNMPVTFIDYVLPSSDEQTTMDELTSDHSPVIRDHLRDQLKPWPGQWQDLQIELNPILR